MESTRENETEHSCSLSRRALGRAALGLAASALAARAGLAAPTKAAPDTGFDPAAPGAIPPGRHIKHDMSGYGAPDGPPQQFALLLYPQMTALDLVGPLQIFAQLMNVQTHLVWKDRNIVTCDSGLPIQPTATLADCPDDLTLLFVPGGSHGTLAVMNDDTVLDFLARRGARARYVTSVCTGSLALGAAGLLKGHRATSHWGLRDLLARFGATPVAERVVEDRNRITGAGVTAGLDFGLRLAARLRNEKMARAVQLGLEYDPQPPFPQGGNPATAGADVRDMERAVYAPVREQVLAAAIRVRRRLETT